MPTPLRQRQPRVEEPAFLTFLRKLPCCACGAHPPVQAAHLRMGSPERGKPSAGIGTKPDDRFCVPLCPSCHLDGPDAQHRGGERRWWARQGKDPFEIAERLYAAFRATVPPSAEDRADVKTARKRIAELKAKPQRLVRGMKLRGRLAALAKSAPKYNRKYNWPTRPMGNGRKLRSAR